VRDEEREAIRREIEIHKQLQHPSIVKMHANFEHNGRLYLILDYVEQGNLYDHMRSRTFDDRTVVKIFLQMLEAVAYLHQQRIIHRDIKPENILIDKSGNFKLCDFGFCAPYGFDNPRQTLCGTKEYLAPEVIDSEEQDDKLDIWCLGILLYELIHKRTPYNAKNVMQLQREIRTQTISYKQSINPELKAIIEQCLNSNPNNRPTAQQLLGNHFLQSFTNRPQFSTEHRSESQSSIGNLNININNLNINIINSPQISGSINFSKTKNPERVYGYPVPEPNLTGPTFGEVNRHKPREQKNSVSSAIIGSNFVTEKNFQNDLTLTRTISNGSTTVQKVYKYSVTLNDQPKHLQAHNRVNSQNILERPRNVFLPDSTPLIYKKDQLSQAPQQFQLHNSRSQNQNILSSPTNNMQPLFNQQKSIKAFEPVNHQFQRETKNSFQLSDFGSRTELMAQEHLRSKSPDFANFNTLMFSDPGEISRGGMKTSPSAMELIQSPLMSDGQNRFTKHESIHSQTNQSIVDSIEQDLQSQQKNSITSMSTQPKLYQEKERLRSGNDFIKVFKKEKLQSDVPTKTISNKPNQLDMSQQHRNLIPQRQTSVTRAPTRNNSIEQRVIRYTEGGVQHTQVVNIYHREPSITKTIVYSQQANPEPNIYAKTILNKPRPVQNSVNPNYSSQISRSSYTSTQIGQAHRSSNPEYVQKAPHRSVTVTEGPQMIQRGQIYQQQIPTMKIQSSKTNLYQRESENSFLNNYQTHEITNNAKASYSNLPSNRDNSRPKFSYSRAPGPQTIYIEDRTAPGSNGAPLQRAYTQGSDHRSKSSNVEVDLRTMQPVSRNFIYKR
jgi:serine/threonine protein kinase